MLVVFIFIAASIWIWKSYNKLVIFYEKCNASFSNIDTELARRFDLYIRATDVLEDGSAFERKIYTEITQLRTRQDLTNAEKIGAVNNLLAVAENNPDIKSTLLFSNMQAAISATETRVQEARQVYNTDVNKYNVIISQLPMKFAARILKFRPRDYFQYNA